MKKFLKLSAILCAFSFLLHPVSVQAYWIWSQENGKFVQPEGLHKRTAEEQYDYALKLHEQGEDPSKVIKALEGLVQAYPESAVAAHSQYMIGVIHEEREEYAKASTAFQKLIGKFPRSSELDQAMERLFKIGNLFLTGQKQKVLGIPLVPVYPKAVEAFKFIVDTAPYSSFGDQAQLRLGLAYRKMGKLDEAVQAFKRLIENYPESVLVDEAHYQLAETSYDFAQVANRDQVVRQEAAENLNQFIKSYQSNSLVERAKTLKQKLDEEDAEKNYRIGLYYETQGFPESAMIYYEDVAVRYADTTFGKKAKEHLLKVTNPVQVSKEKKEVQEKRLVEVQSMLETVKMESAKTSIDQKQQEFRSKLETEKDAILRMQGTANGEAVQEHKDQVRALKRREKKLREKIKAFKKRQKNYRSNSAAGLETVFSRWEKSLNQETQELAKLRSSLFAPGVQIKSQKKKIEHVKTKHEKVGRVKKEKVKKQSKSKKPSVSKNQLLEAKFNQGAWEALDSKKKEASAVHHKVQNELEQVQAELSQLRMEELSVVQTLPQFEALMPEELKTQRDVLTQEKTKLDGFVQDFNSRKDQFKVQFGESIDGARAPSMESVSLDLELELKRLSAEQESTVSLLEKQTEKVESIKKGLGLLAPLPNKAADETQVQIPAPEESNDPQIRLIQKRMKFLEREIRRRLDQVEDWQKQREEHLGKLGELLHVSQPTSSKGKIRRIIASPFAGFVKFGRSFLFGLKEHDEKIMVEARQALEKPLTSYSSDALTQIRELHGEIELQSVLANGRVKETKELEQELKHLQEKGKTVPGFFYQSMLVPRYPSSIHQTGENAALDSNEQKRFADQLGQENAELENLKLVLSQTESKIKGVQAALALKAAQNLKTEKATQQPSMAVSLPGSTETLPTEAKATQENTTAVLDRDQLSHELAQMGVEVEKREKIYHEQYEKYQNDLGVWYQANARTQLIQEFPQSVKLTLEQIALVEPKFDAAKNQFAHAVQTEEQALDAEQTFLDTEFGRLEQMLARFKISGLSAEEENAITSEMNQVRDFKSAVLKDVAVLQSLSNPTP